MKMPNITPGPWHAFEGMIYVGEKVDLPNEKHPTYPIDTPEKEALCQAHEDARLKIENERKWVFYGGCGCCNSWSESAQNEADAVAGAAVPDLIEALLELVNIQKNHSSFGGEMYWDRINKAWEKADAALLKAGCTDA